MMDRTNPGRQTEYHGRRYVAEIAFHLPKEATDDEVRKWLAYEIGGGSISVSHPLYGEEVDGVTVMELKAKNEWAYTDWGAEIDGRRSGRTRIERTPPAGAAVIGQGTQT